MNAHNDGRTMNVSGAAVREIARGWTTLRVAVPGPEFGVSSTALEDQEPNQYPSSTHFTSVLKGSFLLC